MTRRALRMTRRTVRAAACERDARPRAHVAAPEHTQVLHGVARALPWCV
jgi:hypothetical protein